MLISEIAGFEPMGQAAPETTQADSGRSSLAAMGLSAVGIVFGDIGTSPL
jgi:K+ transporter